jgi:hypothetical protein
MNAIGLCYSCTIREKYLSAEQRKILLSTPPPPLQPPSTLQHPWQHAPPLQTIFLWQWNHQIEFIASNGMTFTLMAWVAQKNSDWKPRPQNATTITALRHVSLCFYGYTLHDTTYFICTFGKQLIIQFLYHSKQTYIWALFSFKSCLIFTASWQNV